MKKMTWIFTKSLSEARSVISLPNSAWDWNSFHPLRTLIEVYVHVCKQSSLQFSICGHWLSTLPTKSFLKLSLFFSLQFFLSHRARGGLRISVLSCKLADPIEASRNLSGQRNI